MENMGDWEQKNLINELTQGRELARQLHSHLTTASSSHETREFLVQKILASYEKSLLMLRWSSSVGEPQPIAGAVRNSESPPSQVGSPRSEDSDRDIRDLDHKSDAPRKRKALPRWTQQVRVSPGMGLEGPLDDGFSWRKYGQKDILNAKYPRGYYRCTHRHVQGCLATKQVQRSDEDPTIFEITYRGRHTCSQASNIMPPQASPEIVLQEPNDVMDLQHLNPQPQQQHDHHEPVLSQELMLLNFQANLKVQTGNLDTHHAGQSFPSFIFPSSSTFEAADHHHHPTPEQQAHVFPASMIDNNFVGSYSPSFMSPETSGTNYFSASPGGMNITGFPADQQRHFQSSESELTEIISAATSATNSPTVGLDFPFGPKFDPNFSFDNHGFFS
ncbi:hypothetical protein F2P56_034914 [Juglans regia]|uniref:WRKY domain-containing protein n=2 Tax=Juglans regia TaxID=51240 RepID=A0A833TVD1_JUGRE|nr:probable WRKY transcription factor 53 [Juglans regia]KAF5442229.1 hypothetical protein F2P56_034914 [Juglans regia]